MGRDMRGYVADSGTSGEKCLGIRAAVRGEEDANGRLEMRRGFRAVCVVGNGLNKGVSDTGFVV
jgi:hypothetical protein